jgi:hypothetical protein
MNRQKTRLVRAVGLTSVVALVAACAKHEGPGGADAVEQTKDTGSALNGNPQIGDFVLYAERSVKLAGSDVVSFGDVGVRSAAGPAFGPQLAVGEYSEVPGNLLAPSVSLALDAMVGDVQTSSLQNGGGFLGARAPFPAAMPLLPLGVAPGGGGANVTVPAGQTVTLHPGAYGALDVAGTASLSAGVYSFSSVTVRPQASVLANSGLVDLRVDGRLSSGLASQLLAPTADQLTIEVGGNDGPGGATAVAIGADSQITALVSAPHGTLALGDSVVATGAFAAFDVAVGQFCVVTFQSGLPASSGSPPGQPLPGYSLPPASPLVGAVPASTVIGLAAVLPVRDAAGLQTFIDQVSDPTSPTYRHYMSVSTFASTHGALPGDYGNVVAWASSFGTAKTYPNNLLVDVLSTAGQIEQALSVNLVRATRPDGTEFYQPDRIPRVAPSVILDGMSGVDNYVAPKPVGGTSPIPPTYQGSDLRSAYLGNGTTCSSLTGSGQQVGLVEFDGFSPATATSAGDIGTYQTNTGLTGVPAVQVQAVNLPNNQPLAPSGTLGSAECPADIEMAIAMAPGATVIAFEGTSVDSILSAMATTPNLNQMSSSWLQTSSTSQRFIDEFAAQGQSYFQASGDFGAYQANAQTCSCSCTTSAGGTGTENLTSCPGSCAPTCSAQAPAGTVCGSTGTFLEATPGDSRSRDHITLVGGTNVTTGVGQAWQSETTWPGSGGGYITSLPQPAYQQGLGLSSNRSSPDVAMPATNIYLVVTGCNGGLVNGACPAGKVAPSIASGGFAGTSLAAPLWAGFMALMNENSGAQGPMGFVNPLVYQIGKNATQYAEAFHDINDNSNDANACGTQANATAGYDQATGWGSPSCGLIQLANVNPTISVGVVNPTNAGPVVCMTGHGFTPGGTVTVQYTGIPEFDDSTGPTTFVANAAVSVTSPGGTLQFRDNRQASFESAITTGVAACTAARQASGQVSIQAVDNTTGLAATAQIPASLWCGLGPLSFGASCPGIEVDYHQVGACDSDPTNPGAETAGPFAAYVIFGIEHIENDESASFTVDPDAIFVQRGPLHSSFDTNLSLYHDLFFPSGYVGTPVGAGQSISFSFGAFGAAIVSTLTSDGAVQANEVSYFLDYQPQLTDPPVEFRKSNPSQFTFPYTPDCTTIILK